jgi:hypothetical protein
MPQNAVLMRLFRLPDQRRHAEWPAVSGLVASFPSLGHRTLLRGTWGESDAGGREEWEEV